DHSTLELYSYLKTRNVGARHASPHTSAGYAWKSSYSFIINRPGCGTGYLPSLSGSTGGGELAVSLSTSGANSCWQLSIASNVTGCAVCVDIRPIELTRLASEPRRTSL